tara:strand:- start:456 stop:599 length:144 start_codon:yes stop_codon:yes gene_type:complete
MYRNWFFPLHNGGVTVEIGKKINLARAILKEIILAGRLLDAKNVDWF